MAFFANIYSKIKFKIPKSNFLKCPINTLYCSINAMPELQEIQLQRRKKTLSFTLPHKEAGKFYCKRLC